MKPAHLNTPWKEELDPENLLNHYPRPQLVRDQWLNLNGFWDYAILDQGMDQNSPLELTLFPEPDGQILVPFALETDLSGVSRPLKPGQSLWYRRSLTIPESWKRERLLLHFEAVDWRCVCYINGKEAGAHQGGYLPFHFDITALLKPDGNEIILVVEDSTDDGFQQRGKQVLKPEVIYYEATSGIWQTVWLEPVSPVQYIQSLRFTPDIDSETLEIKVLTAPDNPDSPEHSDPGEEQAKVTLLNGDKTLPPPPYRMARP